MPNQEIAKIFYQIANYLEMDGVNFKPYAYEKAALTLETIKDDVDEIYLKGGVKALEEIPGIGKSMAEKIEEYLKKGRIKYYEELKKKLPLNIDELMKVEGLGPRKIKILYQKLDIRNLKDLEHAAKAHRIAPLFGFGEKTEQNILEGIEFTKREKGRFLLGDILPQVEIIYEKLKNLKSVEEVSLAGSLRRMRETIGDVDFLVISNNPKLVMDFFVSLPGVIKVWGKGATKASVRMKDGYDMDIRVVPMKSYGSALQYFTGSKEHNIALRKIAIDKGLKLSEYGLFKKIKNQKSKIKITNQNSKITEENWVQIAGRNEREIYEALGMDFIDPELRENNGEIEAALKGELPKLVELKDIKGDLHCHSNWNGRLWRASPLAGGANSIEEMAEVAMKLGYEYIGISDHTKFLRIEHGLDEKQLAQQRKEIDKLNVRYQMSNVRCRILQGCEANIMPDGSIDIKDEALAKLDYAIAGVHSQLKMPKKQMTERIIKAMRNPHVDIISHPTGRIIKRRGEYEVDIDEVMKVAKETGTALEINAYPERLDLKDINIRKAKEMGVKMAINTDAHHQDQLRLMSYGVSQARRGWAEKGNIINCQPAEKMLKF